MDRSIRKLDRLTADDRLYFLSYGIFLVTSLLSTSFFYRYYEGLPYMWIQIFCLGLLGAYECRNGALRAQQWAAGCVLAVLTLISLRTALGSLTRLVPMMFVYIYCARRIPFVKIAHFTLKYSMITMVVIMLSGYLGLIDNVVMFKAGRIREFLGFRYTLYPPGILLNMTALWVWLRKDTLRWSGVVFWAVFNWFVYYMTDSRISFVIAEALLVSAVLMKYLPKLVEKLRPLWAALIPFFALCAGGSILMAYCYDGSISWMRRLNSALEGRLNLGRRSLENYGVGLFGQKLDWVGNGLDSAGNSVKAIYSYVDCLYVKLLQRYGIVFMVLLIALLTWSMYRLWKRREYLILLISATVAVHCVLDDLSFALHYNTFWIAMGMALMAPGMLAWHEDPPRPDPPKQRPPLSDQPPNTDRPS